MIFNVECPYCGFKNIVNVGQDYYIPKQGYYIPKEVVTCAVDEGGCERDFVIKVKKEVKIKTFKIEGEEE